MGKGAKRARIKSLVPPGKAGSQAAAPVTSLKLARKLTSKFHALLNEETAVKANAALAPVDRATKLKRIDSEMRAMGGREAYQEASALSTQKFRASRVVFKTCVRMGLQPRKGDPPLQVLEIGAVNPQLVVCPWMVTRAIDLRSRDPKIEQCDFFDIPVRDVHPRGEGTAGQYDILVNLMVLNCVPDPVKRGEMLFRCRDHLKPGGIMFFAIPSRCIDVSEFISRTMFEGLLSALGFAVLEQKRTPKISFYVLRRVVGGTGTSSNSGGGNSSSDIDAAIRASSSTRAGPALLAAPASISPGPAAANTVAAGAARGTGAAAAAPLLGKKRPRPVSEGGSGSAATAAAPPPPSSLPNADAASRGATAPTTVSASAAGGGKWGVGGEWRPVVVAREPGSLSSLARLKPPLRRLPHSEQPVTGFTKTDFSVVVPGEWVLQP